MAFLNPLAPGSSPGWLTRNGVSLPIRRTLRPRRLRYVLTYISTLRALLAAETTSHDGSKPIRHFWSVILALPIRRTLRPRRLRYVLTHMSALRGLLGTEGPSHSATKAIRHFCLSLEAWCGLRIAQNILCVYFRLSERSRA